jgi:predicted Zn-dependent protease
VIVHVDTPTGRGSARLELDAADADPDRAVERTVGLARAAVGQPWASPPPAAPAKVSLLDPALATGDLADAAAAALATLSAGTRPPDGAMVALALARSHVEVDTKQGLHTKWRASRVRGEVVVFAAYGEPAARSLAIAREGRRLQDLRFEAAIAGALADAKLLAQAGAPAPGPCAVQLRADALLHPARFRGARAGADDVRAQLGVWAAFAAQADGVVERQGLTRYRVGAPVAPGADRAAAPLTMFSDGALDFGLASAPIGDDADAVRRFAVVDAGIAAGLGLSPREAALRGQDPNGGVRNLVIAPGTWTAEPDARPRTLDVHRLADLAIDPYTGDASLEIALGLELVPGAAPRPFTGGTLHVDLIAELAIAARSRVMLSRGAYVGPDAVLLDHAILVG